MYLFLFDGFAVALFRVLVHIHALLPESKLYLHLHFHLYPTFFVVAFFYLKGKGWGQETDRDVFFVVPLPAAKSCKELCHENQ